MKPRIRGLLHDHIDGSAVLTEHIVQLYEMAGTTFPFASVQAWQAYFKDPHQNIVEKFDTVIRVMRSPEALELVGYEYGRRRAQEGYRYVEAKFAPQCHVRRGLSLADVTKAMIKGLQRAETVARIRILPVLCINRADSPSLGKKIARLALDYDGEVALDLACDEGGHPPEKHLLAFKMTWGSKVKRDCHAGEWVAAEPRETYRERLLANIRTAVRVLRCHGIGHAIPLADDPNLVAYMVDHGVRVTGCPAAYIAEGAIKDVRELRIDELLDEGIMYSLNADDDLFLPPMERVIEVCDEAYDFSQAHAYALEQNVFRSAFGWRT